MYAEKIDLKFDLPVSHTKEAYLKIWYKYLASDETKHFIICIPVDAEDVVKLKYGERLHFAGNGVFSKDSLKQAGILCAPDGLVDACAILRGFIIRQKNSSLVVYLEDIKIDGIEYLRRVGAAEISIKHTEILPMFVMTRYRDPITKMSQLMANLRSMLGVHNLP